MTFNISEFNPAEEEVQNFDPIVPGWYEAIISDSETKETKSGNGSYLNLTFQIEDGRFVWAVLNLDNPSEKAVRIARSKLASICRAVNVMSPKDSADLHDIPLMIKIGIDKNDADRNVIKGYKSCGEQDDEPEEKPAPKAKAAPAGKKPPWKK